MEADSREINAPFPVESLVTNPIEGLNNLVRLQLETTAFAIRTIWRLIADVERVVTPYVASGGEIKALGDQISLACDCWSIVDQTHMLTELLRLFPDSSEKVLTAFREKYDAAREIRRATRHLRERLKNLAAKKEASAGIFGALTFTNYAGISKSDDGIQRHTGQHVCVLFGGSPTQSTTIKFAEPTTTQLGLSAMQFSALDHSINLSELKSDLPSIAEFLEDQIRSMLRAKAAEHGQTVDLETLPRRPIAWQVTVMQSRWDIT